MFILFNKSVFILFNKSVFISFNISVLLHQLLCVYFVLLTLQQGPGVVVKAWKVGDRGFKPCSGI